MMRNTTLLCCLAAVITVSLFTSCDKSESFSPDITPESPVYTMTVKAGKVATKALALGENSSISATACTHACFCLFLWRNENSFAHCILAFSYYHSGCYPRQPGLYFVAGRAHRPYFLPLRACTGILDA